MSCCCCSWSSRRSSSCSRMQDGVELIVDFSV